MEGILLRKRDGGLLKGIKGWSKRWYSLRKGKLLDFKDSKKMEREGCLPLKSMTDIQSSISGKSIPEEYQDCAFEINTLTKNFVMLAPTSDAKAKWIDNLLLGMRMYSFDVKFYGPKVEAANLENDTTEKQKQASEPKQKEENRSKSHKKEERSKKRKSLKREKTPKVVNDSEVEKRDRKSSVDREKELILKLLEEEILADDFQEPTKKEDPWDLIEQQKQEDEIANELLLWEQELE